MSLGIHAKLRFLEKIEHIYDSFSKEHPITCRECCSDCCTGNVTATSLEVFRIVNYADDFFSKIENKQAANRYIPKTTTNMLAALFAQGKDLPDEETHPNSGSCPILVNKRCPIYPVRPFHCRCMTSTSFCRETGYAQMSPFSVTVNTVCLQWIEHMDAGGFTGNLSDMLIFFKDINRRNLYKESKIEFVEEKFLKNQLIPFLFIPPEHQQNIAPMLTEIQRAYQDCRRIRI